jgi:hypothetical protein
MATPGRGRARVLGRVEAGVAAGGVRTLGYRWAAM